MKIDQEMSTVGKLGISCITHDCNYAGNWFHWHEKYELCQLINKPCRFLINGTLIEALPGDIITFEERCVHCYLVNEAETNIRILQFPIKILLTAGIPITPLKRHIPLSAMKNIPGLAHKVNTLMELLELECHQTENRESPFLFSLSSSLYFLLMQHFPEENGKSTTTKEHQEFLRIVEYINEHFLEDININSLSEKLLLPRGRLSAIFTKYSGINLNEYMNSLRIQNANMLLKQGRTITEAAFESGFQNIRTFNHVYKKITGITPSDYKEK